MVLGLVASASGLLMVVGGTRWKRSVMGSVLVILGAGVAAVGVIFLGIEGLARA
jgi:hypothetical protein